MLNQLRYHLNGNHSLVTVVLLTLWGLTLVLISIDAVAEIVLLVENPVVRAWVYAFWFLFQFALIVPLQLWALVQTSRLNIALYGNWLGVGWAFVLGFPAVVVLAQQNLPGMAQSEAILDNLTGYDPYDLSMSVDEDRLLLQGSLTLGSSRKVAQLLTSDSITRISLDIDAGQLYEARQIARMVATRQLDVEVRTKCLTPCTLILASGQNRIVYPQARIGFQGYGILYPDSRSDWFVEREMHRDIEWYKSRGVAQAFAFQSLYNRTSQEYWYPAKDKLVRAGFIDQIAE